MKIVYNGDVLCVMTDISGSPEVMVIKAIARNVRMPLQIVHYAMITKTCVCNVLETCSQALIKHFVNRRLHIVTNHTVKCQTMVQAMFAQGVVMGSLLLMDNA